MSVRGTILLEKEVEKTIRRTAKFSSRGTLGDNHQRARAEESLNSSMFGKEPRVWNIRDDLLLQFLESLNLQRQVHYLRPNAPHNRLAMERSGIASPS